MQQDPHSYMHHFILLWFIISLFQNMLYHHNTNLRPLKLSCCGRKSLQIKITRWYAIVTWGAVKSTYVFDIFLWKTFPKLSAHQGGVSCLQQLKQQTRNNSCLQNYLAIACWFLYPSAKLITVMKLPHCHLVASKYFCDLVKRFSTVELHILAPVLYQTVMIAESQVLATVFELL